MQDIPRYDTLDPAIEARVDDLLGRMTLAEKVGQLVQITPFAMPDPDELTRLIEQAQQTGLPIQFPPRPGLEDQLRAGSISSLFNIPDPRMVNTFQRIAVEESRLGIPLIIGNDVIHGFRTIFPIPLAEASTWDPDLLERASRVAAEEASAAGIDWIFAPMIDVARDARWGRIAEGAGEDPFLGMEMARARVRGFQSPNLLSGRKVAACPKHYVAYGAAEAGRDYNTVDISERTLREIHLPPFKAAFDAGAGSVMSSFNEIGGVPATANRFVLHTLLRGEWRWPGVVVSDYEAIRELIAHGVAADLKDAARLSILAGLDMDMTSDAYAQHLEALVDEGAVPEKLVNDAARRVLRLKMRLGLFEHPYTDDTLAEQVMLREDFRALALDVARESMVLLKNQDNLLPLAPGASGRAPRIALIGPLADARRDLLGTWVLAGQAEDVETVHEAMRSYLLDGPALTHVAGCAMRGDQDLDIAAAVAAVREADVAVLVLGEGADMSGEARSRSDLSLPGRQQELVDAIAATGTPIIAVLMSGRPLVIPRLAGQAQALLVAWHGGIRAGRAVADLLFGTVAPSGKLTASWPRSEGQIPVYYNHKNTGRPMEGSGTAQFGEPFKSRYIDLPNQPLFPFGYGLSYTTFEYHDLRIESPIVSPSGMLIASVRLKNSGQHAAVEVVQLYVRDLVGSVTRPVKELKGFQRIALKPSAEQTVRFEVPVSHLGCWGIDMRYAVEPGAFAVWIGPNSTEGLEGRFEVRDTSNTGDQQ